MDLNNDFTLQPKLQEDEILDCSYLNMLVWGEMGEDGK